MRLSILQKIAPAIFWLWMAQLSTSAQTANESVLAQGNWYKLAITETGIYKVDANLLRNLGINLENIDPRNLAIYGQGGGMLPQNTATPRLDDLQENAIYLEGEADGNFGNNDYLLFYAQGPDAWRYQPDSSVLTFEHEKNLYADTAFYFLTIQDHPGLRINPQNSTAGASYQVRNFDDYFFHEVEENNIIGSGRRWYGESFNFINERQFNFPLEGVSSDSIRISAAVMARSTQATQFEFWIGSQKVDSVQMPPLPNGTYDPKGFDKNIDFRIASSQLAGNQAIDLLLRYITNGGNGVGYLDYLRFNFQRTLRLYGSQTAFRSMESMQFPVSEFMVQNASTQTQIWDITDPQQARRQTFQLNGNQANFSVATQDQIREFVIFNPSQLPTPIAQGRVSNQNLHGLPVPNLVIISPPAFLSEAQRLATFRRVHDGLTTVVVTPQQIYNEFSSGRQDITAIRDFMKMLYDKDSQALRYLLLLGDASYDYKNRVPNNSNWVPVYEARESLHPIDSYSSDDYYGFLEDGEGEWRETGFGGDHDLEIGIGRLPVKNLSEARVVVDKLITYGSNENARGNWRNQLSFIADDGDQNVHQRDADNIAESLEAQYPNYLVNKLYMDAFEQVSTANGELAPRLAERMNKEVEQGNLIVNFTGHGGEIGWTEERILDIAQIQSWENPENLPLFVTATCEFGRYDDPRVVSGAEEVVLSPRGGGIGLITTTRPVFSNTNFQLNKAFYAAIFEPIHGEMPRLGDAFVITKNNSLSGINNRNFSLLGDPSMRLAYPEKEIFVTHINEKPVNTEIDTLGALQEVTLRGKIVGQDAQIDLDFDGLLEAKVYDKRQTVSTLGTAARVMDYQDRNVSLFQGQATVKDGQFTLTFVIPKDIDYRLGSGKVSLYAKQTNGLSDAHGSFTQLLIGGGGQNTGLTDNEPPEITLYMDDVSFQSGDVVNPDATLIAQLSDENGINISNLGIGHEITATLSTTHQEVPDRIILNEYYLADQDTYQSGSVVYPLENLAPGTYTLNLKAWDTYNNSAEKSIQFLVAEDPVLALEAVFNYPNPLREETTFSFSHNQSGENLEVRVDIYDSRGKQVQTLQHLINQSTKQIEMHWNGLDREGRRITNGVYVYRITVYNPARDTSGQVTQKLIVIH